uniref:Uncharacterized protein n=1 Tax=Glossina brevipalpis TaxID=37001 RepID=A0A1A9X508_9MUSC
MWWQLEFHTVRPANGALNMPSSASSSHDSGTICLQFNTCANNMPSTSRITDAILTTTATAGTATYRYNNSVLLPSLEQRLQMPPTPSQIRSPDIDVLPEINSSSLIPTIGQIASVLVSNFRSPPVAAITPSSSESGISTLPTSLSYHHFHHRPSHHQYQETDLTITSTTSTVSNSSHSSYYPTFNPPDIESLVASSAEEFSNNFRDLSFDVFDDNDNDLFGSPLAFDASENGLWNGRFVPPPPRPPFFVDEPVLTDGLTTCDLCSWAMPTKSTFIFEGTMEKASELGWPLTLTIVSILSALLGAIIMITIVKCRRKKTSHQRSEKCLNSDRESEILKRPLPPRPDDIDNDNKSGDERLNDERNDSDMAEHYHYEEPYTQKSITMATAMTTTTTTTVVVVAAQGNGYTDRK